MTRTLAFVCIVSAMVAVGQGHGAAQQSTALHVRATRLADVRVWDAYVTRAERDGTLRRKRIDRDPMLPARTLERLQQYYDGVPIWGADVVRDSEQGVPISIFGELAPDLQMSTAPELSPGQARAALLRPAAADRLLAEPALVILRLDDGEHRLAYGAAVAGSGSVDRVFLDANTGSELMRYSEMQGQSAVGVGTGVLGDTKKLSVDSRAGTYVTFDRLRPPVIETFDMRGNLLRTKLLERGLAAYTDSDLATDSDNVWNDPAVVDAHAHVSWTYDYYYKRFGRSGLDGRNSPIYIVVNPLSQQGALTAAPADFGLYAVNATWCGVCGPNRAGRILFGSGFPAGLVLGNGNNYTYFSGALDIAAHELTHAVIGATSNLVYRNESGALNEAFADMMGKSVEFFYHPPGAARGQADYVLGKDISRAVASGALSGDRSMANPALYGDPDHFSRRFSGSEDSGGVHINSGIANHAFYLAIEGGTNRTSGLAVQGVGGGNREQIEKVFYRAFTSLLPATATFSTARAATVQSAQDLYGVGSAAERAVIQAWTAVGVM